jgi:hypothetical protein
MVGVGGITGVAGTFAELTGSLSNALMRRTFCARRQEFKTSTERPKNDSRSSKSSSDSVNLLAYQS